MKLGFPTDNLAVKHTKHALNLIPATFERLSNNISKQPGNRYLQKHGRRVAGPPTAGKKAITLALHVGHIVLEDWLLDQKFERQRIQSWVAGRRQPAGIRRQQASACSHQCALTFEISQITQKGKAMTRALARRRVNTLKPGSNVRTELGDETSLRSLGNSLKKRQDTPLLIRADGTIIDGHRRHAAARLVGIEELDCVVTDENLSAADITRIQMVSVIHRADLPLFDRCTSMMAYRDASPGKTLSALAEELDIDVSMPSKLLTFERLIPEAKDQVKSGKIGLRDMIAIAALQPDEQPVLLGLKLGGASAEQMGRQSRKLRDGEPPEETEKAESVKFALTDAIQITVKAKCADGQGELTLSDVAAHLLAAHKEAAKGKEQGLNVRTFSRVMADRAKKPKAVKP
jgi:ParB family transcriptional regulator, chromosome partitioning protein